MSGCCSIKCWFILFNAIFMASGVALIVIGALQYPTYSQIGVFVGIGLSKVAITLIIVGTIITVVSLIGDIGAFFHNSTMLTCFICILIIIILLEIFTGVAFYVFRSRILQMTRGLNTKMMSDYRPDKRHAIDGIQEKFQCCGANGYTDWSQIVGWGNNKAVPDSCCQQKKTGCGQKKEKIHKKGCIYTLKLFLLKNLVWVGGICIVLGITEIFGVIVSICLCLNMKRKNYENIR